MVMGHPIMKKGNHSCCWSLGSKELLIQRFELCSNSSSQFVWLTSFWYTKNSHMKINWDKYTFFSFNIHPQVWWKSYRWQICSLFLLETQLVGPFPKSSIRFPILFSYYSFAKGPCQSCGHNAVGHYVKIWSFFLCIFLWFCYH